MLGKCYSEDPAKVDSFKSLFKKLRTWHMDADSLLPALIAHELIKETQHKEQLETGWDGGTHLASKHVHTQASLRQSFR